VTRTSEAQASPSACTEDQCVFADALFLRRPIAVPANDGVVDDGVDPTYRFGSRGGKKYDPHHGVELLNPTGTPVQAADAGVVVVAGDDRQVLYGPYPYFYGNLVIIQHPAPAGLPSLTGPLYTLYAHLSEISVQAGQTVEAGQEIGRVGMTGAATGSHLHFEVRLGENTYASARNPELWLAPHLDESGQEGGALAGRIIDAKGNLLDVDDIVVEHLPDGPGSRSDWQLTLGTYREKALLDQPPWRESFALGDLPAGWYRLSFPYFGLHQYLVQVFPGKITVVTILAD
jgi:hypothetical protein